MKKPNVFWCCNEIVFLSWLEMPINNIPILPNWLVNNTNLRLLRVYIFPWMVFVVYCACENRSIAWIRDLSRYIRNVKGTWSKTHIHRTLYVLDENELLCLIVRENLHKICGQIFNSFRFLGKICSSLDFNQTTQTRTRARTVHRKRSHQHSQTHTTLIEFTFNLSVTRSTEKRTKQQSTSANSLIWKFNMKNGLSMEDEAAEEREREWYTHVARLIHM